MADTNENTHGALGTIAGFDYQISYFVLRLLTLKEGECVSLEKFEDVGSETDNLLTYYQLKHTVHGTEDKPVNMPLRDSDLWKTISVWIDILSKEPDSANQMKIIENSKFVLITNKKPMVNEFLDKVKLLKENQMTETEMSDYIQTLYDESKDGKDEKGQPVETNKKKQIGTLKDFPLKIVFLKNLEIEFHTDETIKEQIVNELRFSKYITDIGNANCACDFLCGAIFRKFKDSIQKNHPLEYNQKGFAEEFAPCFNRFKTQTFVPTNRNIDIPKEPLAQTFIKQLIDIDYLQETDKDLIISFSKDRLFFENDYNNVKEHIDSTF